MTAAPVIEHTKVIERLTKDAKVAAATLTPREARYLVDTYYDRQEERKRAANQALAASNLGEPNEAIKWLAGQSTTLENRVKTLLDIYSAASPVGRWSRSMLGIGPVIAAGLLAHIDIEKAPTVGHIWNFAGLNPGVQWTKGEKRPWNASLKTLCWKIGDSFVKVSGNPKSYYGKLYRERKALEVARNTAGEYAGQAEEKLEKFKIGRTTDAYAAYSTGFLPPAHLDMRARRATVKIFLSHWHRVAFELRYNRPAPASYAVAHLGHAHEIPVPPAEKGMADAGGDEE